MTGVYVAGKRIAAAAAVSRFNSVDWWIGVFNGFYRAFLNCICCCLRRNRGPGHDAEAGRFGDANDNQEQDEGRNPLLDASHSSIQGGSDGASGYGSDGYIGGGRLPGPRASVHFHSGGYGTSD